MRKTIREYLQENKLVTDGAFGTYFSMLCQNGMFPERANLLAPELVKKVHGAYAAAGAKLVRTNTFAANTEALGCSLAEVLENTKAAFSLAKEAMGEDVYIAGDIGPISLALHENEDKVKEEYLAIARQFIELGADAIVFETFADTDPVLEIAQELRKESDVVIWVQFSVNQLGYSNAGISARTLLAEAAGCGALDIIGFNCGVGPGHLHSILSKLALPDGKYISALPNASYPKIIQDRIVFMENMDYFAEKLSDMAQKGVSVLGGCCGTNPDYIRKVVQALGDTGKSGRRPLLHVAGADKLTPEAEKPGSPVATDNNAPAGAGIKNKSDETQKSGTGQSAFWLNKGNKKLIAVELSPPPTAEDEKLMDAAHLLETYGVDVVTLPDSPSGRTRADSILMAAKVARETSLCVMPHICCRDKNAIAMRSQLLGAYLSDIRNLLIVTGDPVPSMVRADVKGVFNFDSVRLMKLVREMNKESFSGGKMYYGGAINQNRRNLDIEVGRIKKKMEQGAEFFLTQPVFTKEEVKKLGEIRRETGARILCGIMPLVSRKNALFIQNEMTGMNVTDEIVARYDQAKTREEGEKVGIALAKDIMNMAEEFADGYYFSIPFNRVYLLEEILDTDK